MIKHLSWLLGCCLLLWTASAVAQEHYISDAIKVTLRSGPATDRKILEMLTSGQPLEIIEKGDDWSQVRLPSGKEGWVLTRLILTGKSTKAQLAELQQRYEDLLKQSGDPARELKRLGEENAALRQDLAKTRQELADLAEAHRQLEETAAGAKAIRDQRDRLAREAAEARIRIDTLAGELTAARSKSHLWWFATGAGVLVLGLIIGASMRSRQKRSSYF